ncbi:MAG TPA: radical SAM protein [Acetobacteraceae bacterium]|nr:radical SAM protein [Acetobacteraceae bacterium]
MTAIANPLHLERPLKVTISYTHSCNQACRICYAGCTAVPSEREIDGDAWRRVIDGFIADGVISIMFEGGEPLHRSDFLGVLGHCARRVMTKLRSNATLIDAAMAAELRRIGCGEMLVDLWGARAATHDWLTGTEGSFVRTCRGIQAVIAAGLPTTTLLILNRRNVTELQDYLELVHGLGVRRVGILRPYPLGRMRERWAELSLSLNEMMAALAALHPPPGLTVMQSWHPNDANCCWQMAAVNAYGDSIGCTYLREYVNFGNVLETPLAQTWEHPLYRELRSGHVEQSCDSCSASQNSHGGCRSTAYAFHGRWSAPDPFDLDLNEGVDLRVLPSRALPQDARPADAAGA